MIVSDRPPVIAAAKPRYVRGVSGGGWRRETHDLATVPAVRGMRNPTAVTQAILADPIFRHPPHPRAGAPEPSAWDRLLQRIGKAINGFLKAIFHRSVARDATSSALGLVAIALAGLLLMLLVARIVRRGIGGPPIGVSMSGRSTSDESLFADAERAAERGDFERATAYAFDAAVRRLDRANVVPFDPARTPEEYRRAVHRVRTSLDEPFGVVARAFVLAVYGRRPPDAHSWSRIKSAYDELGRGIAT